MPFIPMTEENHKDMLQSIGVDTFEALLKDIPETIRFQGQLNLPSPLSELEVTQLVKDLAKQNAHAGSHTCFLGGGAYDHFIPAAIDHLISRSEFYTAYTPYQPEVSQGNLQTIYEYQSMIAELTGMEVANASMYDGASALAEAVLLANNHSRRPKALISKAIHPFYRQVVQTYCNRAGIELVEIPLKEGITDTDAIKQLLDNQTAGVFVQYPNFLGCLEDLKPIAELAHESGALFGVSVDPIALGILEAPGHLGADIVTGEGQGLGNALNFGGPYVGLFAVNKSLIRKLPGRLVGVTEDREGRRGYVLTLQTREQHIRREKATSSICTNEQLCALASAIYLSLMGKIGFRQVSNLCIQKAHYLSAAIEKIPGYSVYFKQPFFKEFAIRCPVAPQKIIDAMVEHKILAGIDLSRFDYGIEDGLLIAVTEKRTKEEMDRLVEVLASL